MNTYLRFSSGCQISAEPFPDALPTLLGRLGSGADAIGGEESVAGALVSVELVGLPMLLQYLLYRLGLGRRGVGVLSAEQAEQRAVELARLVDDRLHADRHASWRRSHHEGSVAINCRIEVQAASGQEGLAAA